MLYVKIHNKINNAGVIAEILPATLSLTTLQ